jgi:ABC-type nitrate/sulfonate/bicarbonate transport system substrate-binding protein
MKFGSPDRPIFRLAVLLLALLPLCSVSYAVDRVIIGNVSRTVEQLPNYAATDKGFFTQEGIEGDVVLIGSTDTLIQALISGHVNVAIVDPSAAINAVERGASLKIIGGTVPIAAYTLITCPKYKSIKDLKGTTIGTVSLVSGSTIFLREMLKSEGLELNRDYTIVQNGPTGQRLASLKNCSTSATMILGGDLPRSRELGFLEIAKLSDYIPNLQFHSLIVDSRWAEANRPLTIRYLKAMVRAMQWAHANREQAAELVSKRTGIPLKSTRVTVDEYLSQGIISRDGSVNREGFQRLIDLMGERLFKSKPYPGSDKYLDMSYLRRAHQELGISAEGKK